MDAKADIKTEDKCKIMNKKVIFLIIGILLFNSILSFSVTRINNERSIQEKNIKPIDDEIINTVLEPLGAPLDWWPMFQHDTNHSGFSTSTKPSHIVDWSIDDYAPSSSAIVVNNFLYFGSSDYRLYCLDANDGSVEWSYLTGATVVSTPSVVDDYIYFGSNDNNIYCLDANDGSVEWSYLTGGGVWSSPAVVNNRVFIGSSDNKLYCLDATNGNYLWNYTAGYAVSASPVVSDDKVYFGYREGSNGKFMCLNAIDGIPVWNSSLDGYPFLYSSPGIYDNYVYQITVSSTVHCFDLDDGNLEWTFSPSGTATTATPVFSDGFLYFGRLAGAMYCLDAYTGDLEWINEAPSQIWSSAAVADGHVYFQDYSGTLYCLDAVEGVIIWEHSLNGGLYAPSPVIADGFLYTLSGASPRIHRFGGFDGNNPPETPDVPTGPDTISPGVEYEYCVTVPNDAEGDDVYVLFDWGDMSNSGWLGPYTSGEEVCSQHTWDEGGTYDVKVIARDTFDADSPWSDPLNIYVNTAPETPELPSGPDYGYVNVEYEYCVTVPNDVDGDDVYVLFDWGDGTDSGWLGPYQSSETACAFHSWVGGGDFEIKAQAFDSFSYNDWSDPLNLHINLPPAVPMKPGGSSSVQPGINSSYNVLFPIDPEDDDVSIFIDWGDGNDSGWLGPYVPGAPFAQGTHAWYDQGFYEVKAKAKDIYNTTSEWSEPTTIHLNLPPGKPQTPTGENNGLTNVEYEYCSSSIDPGDEIQRYQFVWGDGNISWEIGPFDSGEEVCFSYAWAEPGVYNVTVQSWDEYYVTSVLSDPLVVTVSLSNLIIITNSTVIEESNFTVTIKREDNDDVVENATVSFNEETKPTDSNGQVIFTAPEIDKTTQYLITAEKQDFIEDSKTIWVTNQKEQIGWIWGTIYSSTGDILENASISLYITKDEIIRKYSDASGQYIIAVPPGIYTVTTEKEGYEPSTQKDIVITLNKAINQNFILTKIKDYIEPPPDKSQEKINTLFVEGKVGVEFTIKADYKIIYHLPDIEVKNLDINPEKKAVSFNINSEKDTSTILLFTIVDESFITIEEDFVIEVDGQKIFPAPSYADFLNSNSTLQYYILNDLILINIEFSEHTITISQVIETISILVVTALYVIICIVGISTFIYPFFAWPGRIRKGKKL